MNASGERFINFFIACLHFLSAASVTEQVLITYISAIEFAGTLSNFSSGNDLEIVDVSAKLSLHPSVWNATFFLLIFILINVTKRLRDLFAFSPLSCPAKAG